MGANFNGYVRDEAIVRSIESAARVEGVSPSKWVGDTCIIRLRSEGRLVDNTKTRLQVMIAEAVDEGADVQLLEDAIMSIHRGETA